MNASHTGGGRQQQQQQEEVDATTGWPLGLNPIHLRRSILDNHHLRFSASDSLLSTPSASPSSSSSDMDTQSTVSFFPERSTTLGSLIGFRAMPQRMDDTSTVSPPLHNNNSSSNAQEMSSSSSSLSEPSTVAAAAGGGAGAGSSLGTAASAILARTRSWCPCRNFSHPQSMGISPSLAHLLEMERKMTAKQLQLRFDKRPWNAKLGDSIRYSDKDGATPRSSRTPLKLMLEQSCSPVSSYMSSADWVEVSSKSSSDEEEEEEGRGNMSERFRAFGASSVVARQR